MATQTQFSRATMEAALEIAEIDWDDTTIRNYSGRGMYGDECMAVVLDGDRDTFALFAALGIELDDDEAIPMARSACQDSMGRSIVIYWPRLRLEG
jgi:hypothetical protein